MLLSSRWARGILSRAALLVALVTAVYLVAGAWQRHSLSSNRAYDVLAERHQFDTSHHRTGAAARRSRAGQTVVDFAQADARPVPVARKLPAAGASPGRGEDPSVPLAAAAEEKLDIRAGGTLEVATPALNLRLHIVPLQKSVQDVLQRMHPQPSARGDARTLAFGRIQNIYAEKPTAFQPQPELFQLGLGSHVISSAACRLVELTYQPTTGVAPPMAPAGDKNSDGPIYQARQVRARLSCAWADVAEAFSISWQLSVAPEAPHHFVRTSFALTSHLPVATLPPRYLVTWQLRDVPVIMSGTVPGSPIYSREARFFAGLEHPMSSNGVLASDERLAVCGLMSLPPLAAGATSFTYTTVIGMYRHGADLQRAFWAYLSQVRASPARPFLHYNSWFDFYSWQERDVAFADRNMTERSCIDRVERLSQELVVKRGVQLDAFLWDDGWDDHKSLWSFHSGFPRGLTPVAERAQTYGADVAVWVSPWGGYGSAKDARVAYGRRQGYELNRQGFSLSGPRYFERFKAITLDFVTKYHVAMFKFDGISFGEGAQHEYLTELEGLLRLLQTLRREARRAFWINLTTGMWPSPFWLLFGDSIWRGHGDIGLHGEGTRRQQWINFRDAVVYKLVVQRAGLFPVSALMLHGIITGNMGQSRAVGLNSTEDLPSFRDEVWSYFATGVQLQELYVSPDTMSAAAWDIVAAASKWARQQAPVLQQARWVGGDAVREQAYGFAAHVGVGVTLSLRNPSLSVTRLLLRLATAFAAKASCGSPDSTATVTLSCRYSNDARCLTHFSSVCSADDVCTLALHTQLDVEIPPAWTVVLDGRLSEPCE
ncbi:uncharacterized protein MONBRDRAFT_29826 [Monosiga brevicollis MX1]|uniref:Alpha-galactosidase n=1 Tax=Monosiga brevicollis TaxID=81824 RepID=A9VC85_MONBE|nr:uncharacterized protein MONBRDRAFT_29826 [Monosiga brevicollis MX1]EDQ84856.1 predicted protein [Monosiga brevicollis MX1]|eukprot:XP_001750357.1 hypothetical protein [Monosiga brevicollis MX1]